jgi:hypothetical protein
MILDQGGIKMILVGRYDHRIILVEKKQCRKRTRINLWRKILKFPYLNLNVYEVILENW